MGFLEHYFMPDAFHATTHMHSPAGMGINYLGKIVLLVGLVVVPATVCTTPAS